MFISFIDLNIIWSLMLIFGVEIGFCFSKFSKSLFGQGQIFFFHDRRNLKGLVMGSV